MAYVLFDGNNENHKQIKQTTTRFNINEWQCDRKNQLSYELRWENVKTGEVVVWRRAHSVPPTMKREERSDVRLQVSGAGQRQVNGSYIRRGMSTAVAKYCKRIGGTEVRYEVARMPNNETKRQMWWLYKTTGNGYTKESKIFYNADNQDDTPPSTGWRPQTNDVKAPGPTLT
eukprot:TRINITY_DN5075_c0_g1_i1.p1 TRINITY_DN5075_c0_g1~~TRINITY_DN5075_c0_g1_i1.p1  ORF type:complete len:173 (-),score=34.45 TRINITY_DN5075_c0_g1_i1:225-743(-)